MIMTRTQRSPLEAIVPPPAVQTREPARGVPVYVSVLAAIGVSLLLWAGIFGLISLIF